MDCKQFEGSLAAVADGGATPEEAARVAHHVETCAACRHLLATQTTARAVLRARAAQLSMTAPPGLRTRIDATRSRIDATPSRIDATPSRIDATPSRIDATPSRIDATTGAERVAAGMLSWPGRLSAFSAAAIVVMVIGAALLPVVTARSTVALAAQMALDHLKCFSIDGDADGPAISPAAAEWAISRDYGWTMSVPASDQAEGLVLFAVRRCLYGDGFAAHLLYRVQGQPVSLFIMPGLSRPDAALEVLGHDAVLWTDGDRTYMLVARAGTTVGLARVASYLRNEAK